ncbi:acetoacetyl-CoA reductase [Lacibacterium aquatile]|uniref:Acetoacetyl-CoA reductase n=1 Tax=Lacibacterium aquatile TaxID=1168082 RepID=A0ABW5DRK7_9PROT
MTRVAIVTGGTRGIGAAIAQAFKKQGYKVAVTYSGNEEAAEKFRKETGILALKWDASNFAESVEGVKKVEAQLGPVDILVNNAGITRDTTFHKMTEEQWDDVIRINLKSCFSMTRAVIEGMRERGFGRIVQISSVNGQRGQYGQANYGAAKAGMIGFTKSLAFEGANKGITVNCVAPGYVDTDMVAAVPEDILKKIIGTIPVGRLGYADDIARAVLFLAGDENGFVTGATLSVNGGQYMVA